MKRLISALMLTLASLALPVVESRAVVIDLGTFGGHQYSYDTGSYHAFADARAAAKEWPTRDLVSITSAEENAFLVTAIASMRDTASVLRCAWIGLFRTSGPLQWASGDAVSYTNWRPAGVGASFAEPTGEDAGVMYINGESGIPPGLWADTWSSGAEAFNALQETAQVSGVVDGINDQRGPSLTVSSESPFRRSVECAYRLATDGDVRVTVRDLQGRLVTTLVHARRAAGGYTVRWDGRDVTGTRVVSGLYVVRLESPGAAVLAKKVMLCR